MCDDSFKIIIDYFIQSDLNIMILYVSSQLKSMYFPTYVGPTNLVSKGKS